MENWKRMKLKSNNKMSRFYAVVMVAILIGITFSQVMGNTIFTSDTVANIESRFTNLVAGTTLVIPQPATSYRTDQWLDIDVSNVRIVFQSTHAADGNAIVLVADNADVGGIRIGNNAVVNNVTIENFGFDGNQANQNNAVKLCHGIRVCNASNVTIDGFYITGTHPFHEHDTGGSGIQVETYANNYSILNGFIASVGDQGLSLSGNDGFVHNVECINGYDRHIAISETSTTIRNITLSDIRLKSNSDGSGIGIRSAEHITINNIRIWDAANSGIKIYSDALPTHDIQINNYYGYDSNVDSDQMFGITIEDDAHNVSLNNMYFYCNGTTAGRAIIFKDNCRNIFVNNVDIKVDDGTTGFRGIWFNSNHGTSITCNNVFVHGDRLNNAIRFDENGTISNLEIDITGSGASVFIASDVNFTRVVNYNAYENNASVTDNGENNSVNGIASQSRNAEEPMSDGYHWGDLVQFTDSGDGSGTGLYIRRRNNTWGKID